MTSAVRWHPPLTGPSCRWLRTFPTHSGHRTSTRFQHSETGIPAVPLLRPFTIGSDSATNLKRVRGCISVNVAFQLVTVTLELRTHPQRVVSIVRDLYLKKDTLVIAEQSIAFEGRCMWLRIETRYCPSLFEGRVYGAQVRQISVFRLVCIRGRLLLALVQRPRIAITIFVAIDLFCERFDTISVRTFILQHTCINHPSVEEPFTASKYYYSPCVFPLS